MLLVYKLPVFPGLEEMSVLWHWVEAARLVLVRLGLGAMGGSYLLGTWFERGGVVAFSAAMHMWCKKLQVLQLTRLHGEIPWQMPKFPFGTISEGGAAKHY